MSREEVAALPFWEKELLAASGRSILGLDENADSYGDRELSESEVRNIILREG